MNEFRSMHLFAGIGGGILADLILGHRPIIAVEWDKYACKVLRERAADGWFPDLRVWEGDVRLFDPSEYTGKVDCIHAGFPCQDISLAGKQAGVSEGTRSGLYREVLRIASVVRPQYLFLENVSAILSNGLGSVLGDLASMGYDCRWLCIRASDVGAPHGRDRWFALAERHGFLPHADSCGIGRREQQQESIEEAANVRNAEHDGQIAAKVTGSSATGSDCSQTRTQQASESGRSGEQHAKLAYTQRDRLQGGWEDREIERQAGLRSGTRRNEEQNLCNASSKGLQNRSRESMEQSRKKQEFKRSDWWSTQSDVGQLANGVPDRVGKLKGLGNAQVPLQAAAAFRLLQGKI